MFIPEGLINYINNANINARTNKVVDCFTFYNELDLLNYRLNVLNDVVDYFVIVESEHTHTGKKKPLIFNENRHLFGKFNAKIVHVVVDDFPHKYPHIDFNKNQQWVNEMFQRNAISRGLSRLDLTDCDLILITDLDEIPDPSTVAKIQTSDTDIGIRALEMDLYYYNLTLRFDNKWNAGKICTFRKYAEHISRGGTVDDIRRMSCSNIIRGGWHLSYFGDSEFIKNKINAFAHQEFNLEVLTNVHNIDERIRTGKDPYDRSDNPTKIELCENMYLPVDYEKYLTRFMQ